MESLAPFQLSAHALLGFSSCWQRGPVECIFRRSWEHGFLAKEVSGCCTIYEHNDVILQSLRKKHIFCSVSQHGCRCNTGDDHKSMCIVHASELYTHGSCLFTVSITHCTVTANHLSSSSNIALVAVGSTIPYFRIMQYSQTFFTFSKFFTFSNNIF